MLVLEGVLETVWSSISKDSIWLGVGPGHLAVTVEIGIHLSWTLVYVRLLSLHCFLAIAYFLSSCEFLSSRQKGNKIPNYQTAYLPKRIFHYKPSLVYTDTKTYYVPS